MSNSYKRDFRVTKGGALPFAFDIVASTLKYGFKCFIKYLADLPDYFKLAFPAGLTYDRKLTFEDGGCASATVEMRQAFPYYLAFYQLFDQQIAQRSLREKERFLIRYLLISLLGFKVTIFCE